MILNCKPTPEGITGGCSSIFVKFGGFRFFIVNYDYDKSYGYGDSSFYPLSNGYPYRMDDFLVRYPMKYFEISSNDSLYVAEVERLKKAFKTNPNSKFKAIGYTANIGTSFDIVLEYTFAFDFNDIFETSIIGIINYSDTVRLQESPFWNAIYNVSDSLVGGDGTKKDMFYTEALYAPVDFVQHSSWGSSWNWHAGVGILIFEFPSYYSVLVPRAVPSLSHPFSGGTVLIATFNHYKVAKNTLCCLAQCFGITE